MRTTFINNMGLVELINPHQPELNNNALDVSAAAHMLYAITQRLGNMSLEGLQELIASDPTRQMDFIGAISNLHKHVFPHSVFTEANPQLSLHEQIGNRILSLDPNKVSGAVVNFRRNAAMDAGNFSLEDMPKITVHLPNKDIFHSLSAQTVEDTYDIYPSLASYILKSIIGQDSPAKRKLVDLLDDRQIIELISYACIINKNLRQANAALANTDKQSSKLIMHLTGKTDSEIGLVDPDHHKNSTGHIRRSRRTMIKNIQRYEDLLLFQIGEMIADKDYTLLYEDSIYGISLLPEAADALDIIVETPDRHLTPKRMIELAVRRYVANSLLEEPPKPLHLITAELRVIWLKIHGVTEEEIESQTGYSVDQQTKMLLELQDSKQHELPLGKKFWRQVRQLMAEATGEVAGQGNLTPQGAVESISAPMAAQTVTGRDQSITEAQAIELADATFKEHLAKIVKKGKVLEFILWGQARSSDWVYQMQCRNDLESLSIDNITSTLPQPLLERCISCPVREICFAQALGKRPTIIRNDGQANADYYFGGFAPAERAELLIEAGLNPRDIEAIVQRTQDIARARQIAAQRGQL